MAYTTRNMAARKAINSKQREYLERTVSEIYRRLGLSYRQLAKRWGTTGGSVQRYAGAIANYPLKEKPAAAVLKQIQKDAQNPEEFGQMLLDDEESEEAEREAKNAIAIETLSQTVLQLQLQIERLETRLERVEANQQKQEPQTQMQSDFVRLIQAHMQAMHESVLDVARSTRIPVGRIEEFLSGKTDDIESHELSALGIWYGSIEPLMHALGLEVNSDRDQGSEHHNSNGTAQHKIE
jgi:transcriptional regulator with XRE-family HTH domain